MTAWVRRAKGGRATVSVWSGGQAPLSSELAAEFRRTLEDASDRCSSWPEVRELLPLLSVQASHSMIPGKEQLLMERLVTRQGVAWFLYPFEGRLSHEGLASLLAYRMSLSSKMSLSMTFNDYGIHILSEEDPNWTVQDWRRFLDPQNLSKDLEQAIHTVEMDRRQFRDVARIAGPGLESHGTCLAANQPPAMVHRRPPASFSLCLPSLGGSTAASCVQ